MSTNLMPRVLIIVLNWKGWRDTLECIDSLAKIKYPNYEALIIDNGSGDESVPCIKKHLADKNLPNFKFILFDQNFGFAGGNNKGIGQALKNGAEYVLLLNNDTTVDPLFLEKLVEAGEKNNSIGIIGSKIYFYTEPDRIWFAGGKINWLKTTGSHLKLNEKENTDNKNSAKTEKILPMDYITGCAMLIKKEVIEEIGVLSEDYFLYYEDTDYCLRAKKAGWQCVLAPESRIWHKISRSTKEFSPSYLYYHTRNGLMMAKKTIYATMLPAVYIFSFYLAIKQVVKYIFTPSKREWAKMVLMGILDFYKNKTGKFSY